MIICKKKKKSRSRVQDAINCLKRNDSEVFSAEFKYDMFEMKEKKIWSVDKNDLCRPLYRVSLLRFNASRLHLASTNIIDQNILQTCLQLR